MIRVPAAAEKNTRTVAAVWPEGSCLGVRATWRRLSDRAERGNRLQISKVLISPDVGNLWLLLFRLHREPLQRSSSKTVAGVPSFIYINSVTREIPGCGQ
jgi:hypothetical protein